MNRSNLRNVIAIAVCFAGLILSSGCKKTEDTIIGKWVTSDYHAGENDTIVFKENSQVGLYFDYFVNEENSTYMTYSLSDEKITFTTAFSELPPDILEYIPVSETFEYTLKNNSLTIKGFSNPFSLTNEARTDVRFKKVKE